MNLDRFREKLNDYATNNITALLGQIQITANELDDLRLAFGELSPADQTAATALLREKKVDLAMTK